MAKTKAELEQALLREREAHNAAHRDFNDAIKQRDEYRQQLFDSATSLQKAYAQAAQYASEAADLEHRLREREVERAGLQRQLEVAGLKREVAEQKTEVATLRRTLGIDSLRRQIDAMGADRARLQAALPRPPALTLEHGTVLAVEHPTYGGGFTVDGYHYQGDSSLLEVRLRRQR